MIVNTFHSFYFSKQINEFKRKYNKYILLLLKVGIVEVQRIIGEESNIRKILYIFLTVSLIAAIAFIVPKILEQNKMEEGVEYLSKNESEKAINHCFQ